MYDDNRQEPEEFQTCPECDGCGCNCGATDCNRHCCNVCHTETGECKGDEIAECGIIPTAQYVELQNEKLERRRMEWLKGLLILLIPNVLLFGGAM